MKKLKVLFFSLGIFLLGTKTGTANFINANPSNYTTFISSLVAGDTLYLAAGTYTNNLTLNNLNGTALAPIVIMGSPNLYSTIFNAQSCCNTVSITKCSYIVIKKLQLNGLNQPVDAVKGEGTYGNFAHHITIEYLNIINYGNNQQIVGISTKCHAWDWIIRKNRIIGAGTGMYLGNSNGDRPFVNGIIENNFISNTIGYNIEIKHQSDTVRSKFTGTAINGKTIIRNNVFCKELNAATGGNARPNLLVGGFPLTGFGLNDYYDIYGNFFYQNPTEALFQGTGNIILYENIFVNHVDPAGYRAVYITPQNGVQPQNIKVFHNTMWAVNSSGGMRLFNANTSYTQHCYSNAVFAPSPITNFANMVDNITDTYANAGVHVISPTTNIATLNLYPKSGQLTGTLTPGSVFMPYTNWDKDFNNTLYNWIYRGAYSGCCTNPGWQLQLDTMVVASVSTTAISELQNDNQFLIYPNPTENYLIIITNQHSEISLFNSLGILVKDYSFDSEKSKIDLKGLAAGIYFIQVRTGNNTLVKKIIKQ